MTRELSINNPGGIRRNRIAWIGMAEVQNDPDFVTFVRPMYGVRALGKVLTTYAGIGLNTITGLITRWAPPHENDTDAYIAHVCELLGKAPNQILDVHAELPALADAIIRHENGKQPYTMTDIESWIYLS